MFMSHPSRGAELAAIYIYKLMREVWAGIITVRIITVFR